jgi:enoyl-CoA hydratase
MIAIERAGRVLVATLSRPPVNALNETMIGRLGDVLDEAVGDGFTVLHLRSDQKVFCAGADLALMRACFAGEAGPDAMLEVVVRMQRLFARIEAAPVVSIAEIGGAALGGGLELALACDFRIAALEAALGLPEAQLGLVPGAGGTQRLTRLCGAGTARRLILGAEVVEGSEAQRLGLVQWSVRRPDLPERARALAARIGELPRAALAAAKRCIAAHGHATRNGFVEELASTRALYDDPVSRAKVNDFLNRSKSENRVKETL